MSDYTLETIEHNGLTIKIIADTDPESPREWSTFGRMVCWHRRYNLGDWRKDQRYPEHTDGTTFSDPGDFREWWRENGKGGVILPLFLYDHSGITMSTGPFSCPWDSGQVEYIYATREMILAEFGGKILTAKRKQQAEKILRQEVETYDQYLTGDIWGYVIEDEEGNYLESCWGFYGSDYCKTEALSMADHLVRIPNYAV